MDKIDENLKKQKSNNEFKMTTIHPINGTNEGISYMTNKIIDKQQAVVNDRSQPFEFC